MRPQNFVISNKLQLIRRDVFKRVEKSLFLAFLPMNQHATTASHKIFPVYSVKDSKGSKYG